MSSEANAAAAGAAREVVEERGSRRFNYHAVPGNIISRITWKRLAGFVEQWLPPPKILHPYPYFRIDANYPR